MANIIPVDNWSDIPQIEQTDYVLGGEGQIANQQAQALANRTENLKNTVTANKNTQDNKNDSIDSAISDLNTNKVNISDIVNNTSTTTSGKVLDGRMGKTLNDIITSNYNTLNTNKVNISDVVNNYTTTTEGKVLDARVAVALKTLIDGKQPSGSYVLTSNVVNNTSTTTSGKVLDARVGKSLKDLINTANTNITNLTNNKVNKSDVVNNTSTTTSGKVLDARVGKTLNDNITNNYNTLNNNKVNKSDVVNNTTTTDSGKILDARVGKTLNNLITNNYNTLNTNKINKSDIVDNLTTDSAVKVLSAKQGKVLNEKIMSYVPTGTVLLYFGNSSTPPTGFLFCNGATNLSKTTYANLYAVLGSNFSTGANTFKVPDLRRKFLQGHFSMGVQGIVMGEISSGLPNITGGPTAVLSTRVHGTPEQLSQGALYYSHYGTDNFAGSSNWGWVRLAFNASKSNSIYGGSDIVQPPAVLCNVIIKY